MFNETFFSKVFLIPFSLLLWAWISLDQAQWSPIRLGIKQAFVIITVSRLLVIQKKKKMNDGGFDR